MYASAAILCTGCLDLSSGMQGRSGELALVAAFVGSPINLKDLTDLRV